MNKDVIIIGGGPAGLSAAIYAARGGLKALVMEKALPGGKLLSYDKIENYPGFTEGISSPQLGQRFKNQADNFGAEFVTEKAVSLSKDRDLFEVKTENAGDYKANSVIISCGTSRKKLGVSGEDEYVGKGVSYCAVCDGPLFKNREVAVVGGGNAACEEAIFLSKFARKVNLIHRRPELRAVECLRKKIERNEKIELILSEEVQEIRGNGMVKSLGLKKGGELKVNGVFIYVGMQPNTGFVKGFLKTEDGFIVTAENLEASVEGAYAAGDCRYGAMRQVISACGEGARAAEEARKYIEKKKGKAYDW